MEPPSWIRAFAVLLLHQRSKRPKESKWTSGKRASLPHLRNTYKEGDNIGVRLGEASLIGKNYLACIDVDIKNPAYKNVALAKLKELIGDTKCPTVKSGSGNGSRHLYCVTANYFKMLTIAKEKDKWEICIYSTGRQMVLPPSIHPDTGKKYEWVRSLEDMESLPLMKFEGAEDESKNSNSDAQGSDVSGEKVPPFKFQVSDVELSWLPISDQCRRSIVTGEGVDDRSGFLLRATSSLLSTTYYKSEEVLSVLTDKKNWLGAVGYDHAKTNDRKRAAEWIYRYTFKKVSEERSDILSVFTKAGSTVDKKLTPKEIEKQNKEIGEDRPWQQDIIRGGQKGDGAPKSLVTNIVLILKNAVKPDLVRRDEFAYRDTYSCDTPWGGKKNEIIGNDDVARIKYWLGKNYNFEPKSNTIDDALAEIACQNSYDPVKNMLNRLPVWDGVNRLDTWLLENFEAEGDSEYLAQVFRKWMYAMVMRVYQPGAKFDWMPIFEGAQGVGKSSFGRLLVGDKHFLRLGYLDLNNKDSDIVFTGHVGC